MGVSRVLELRIHGIANAPAAETLSSSDEQVERKDGDEQGSFWRVKPSSPAAAPMAPSGNLPPDVEVVTEAYSWGNQARSGGSSFALVGRAIVHLGWLLVLPFGLCNLAYWARRDIKGQHEPRRWKAGGDGAAMVRIFALLQTLFYTIGLVTVSVYLIGLQCYNPAKLTACAALPQWLDFLAQWSPTARAALLSILPIAVIFLIYVIGLRARGNFHPERSFNDEGTPRKQRRNRKLSDPPHPPLLASTKFWQRARATQISERTHLSAVFSLVMLLLAADALMDATGSDPIQLVLDAGVAAVKAPVPFWGTVLGALLLVSAFAMVFASGRSGNIEGDRVKRNLATALVLASALLYVGWCAWAISSTRGAVTAEDFAGDREFNGLIVVPGTIATLGGIIAIASLTWGYGLGYRIASWVLLGLAFGCVAAAEFWSEADPNQAGIRAGLSIAAAGIVVLAVVVSYSPVLSRSNWEQSRDKGWHGNGAAVALLIAWFSSLVITTLLVLGVHKWLTSDADSPAVDSYWRTLDDDSKSNPLELPAFYERFAGLLVVILIVLVVIALCGLATSQRRFPAFSQPGLMFPHDLDPEELARQRDRDEYWGGARRLVAPSPEVGEIRTAEVPPAGTKRDTNETVDNEKEKVDKEKMTKGRRGRLFNRWAIPWNEYPTSEIKPSGRPRAIVEARRIAGLAHRGESLMRALAIITGLALVPLAIPYIGEQLMELGLMATLVRGSGWALGLLAIATVAWVVTNAVTSTERPLGLVWDIICFFPRAGHPFSPPCYSDRAVPEIKKRIMRFLKEERKAGNEPYVILSAHSMGATIAIAAIFSLYEEAQEWPKDGVVSPSYDPTVSNLLNEPGRAKADEEGPNRFQLHRIALLTHGVQLRPYFSRFFPEVFGPRVLGIRGTRGPALLRSDPWTKQVVDEAKEPITSIGANDDPPTIVSLLGGDLSGKVHRVAPRWRNLWRRTDYLGFPVFGYWSNVTDGVNENPIDRGATEHSPRSYLWTVARHNDYLSTLQYREARDELVSMLARPREKTRASDQVVPT